MRATAPPESVLTLPTPDVDATRDPEPPCLAQQIWRVLFSFYRVWAHNAVELSVTFSWWKWQFNSQWQIVNYGSRGNTSRDIDKLLFGTTETGSHKRQPRALQETHAPPLARQTQNRTGVALKAAIHVGSRWRRVASRPRGGHGENHGALPTSSVLSRYY